MNNKKKLITQNIPNAPNNTDNIINKKKNDNKKSSINDLPEENPKIKNKIEKIQKIMEYIDDEKNDFEYNLSLRYDKRTYCQYYLSLIKTKHNLIFSFFYNKDYNSRIIKNDLFFIGFALNYTVNALFYNDSTMHNIYRKNGSSNIEYQLPKIVYSSLISLILETLIKMFALSNNKILEFKNNKEPKDVKKRKKSLNKKLKIIFILYFVLSFILLLFFWYYISMFGAVYKNTQYHLLKDTLLSFGLSLLYPFGIFLLPGLFRIPALSNGKRECLYKFSKILQII